MVFTKVDGKTDILGIGAQECENLLDKSNYVEGLKKQYPNMNDGIQFAEVFDSKDFPDNDTLSLYMGLSSQLSQKKGTMLLTYGYSGVGKTVTLFGNKKKKIFGLLQRTLLNVKSQGKILFRVFELYGKGFKLDTDQDDYSSGSTYSSKSYPSIQQEKAPTAIIRKLSRREKKALNVLCKGAALRYLLTRTYDYLNTPKSAIIKIKNPHEYIQKLNMHNKLKSFKDYYN